MNVLCRVYYTYNKNTTVTLHMLDIRDAWPALDTMEGEKYCVAAETAADGNQIIISPMYDTELEVELMILHMFETGVLLDRADPVMRTWCARPVSTPVASYGNKKKYDPEYTGCPPQNMAAMQMNPEVQQLYMDELTARVNAINRTNGECMRHQGEKVDIRKSLWPQEIMDEIVAIDKQKAEAAKREEAATKTNTGKEDYGWNASVEDPTPN